MSRLTIGEIRTLDFGDLLRLAEDALSAYDAPAEELQLQKLSRLSRILDEMPAVYRTFRTLQSWCDHWADGMKDQFGQSSMEYKNMRQRRDALDRFASAAKLAYEGASRQITIMESFDERGMPISRGYERQD